VNAYLVDIIINLLKVKNNGRAGQRKDRKGKIILLFKAKGSAALAAEPF